MMEKQLDTAAKTIQAERIRDVLSKYDLGNFVRVESLTQGYANENLLVVTERQKVLYRICKQQPLPFIEYEVRLMFALEEAKVKTAFPIADKQRVYIHSHGENYVMLYDFVCGEEPELTTEVAHQMGIEVGKISMIPLNPSLEKKNAVHIDHCHQLIAEFSECQNPLPEVFDYFERQTHYLASHLDSSLPRGIVHGDLFPNNTIFKDQVLQAIIDFEEACSDQLLFDVGMTINGFCFVDNLLQPDLLKAFLSGYNTVRKLSDTEWQALPVYMQWGSHGMLSWHLRNNLIQVPNPEQYQRVLELMRRTEWMRSNENQLLKSVV